MKLSTIGENVELYEAKASSLTDEINALKEKRAHSNQDLPAAKKKHATKKVQTIGNIELIDKQVNKQENKKIEE